MLFHYSEDICKAEYTTNAIESLNSGIRKAINECRLFLTDDCSHLVIIDASKKNDADTKFKGYAKPFHDRARKHGLPNMFETPAVTQNGLQGPNSV